MNLNDRLLKAFPWGIESGIRSTMLTLGCAIGLIIIWFGVHGHPVFDHQLPWLAAGIVILLFSMYSHVSLIIRARRAIGERRARLFSDALVGRDPILGGPDLTPDILASFASEAAGADRVLVGGGLGMYHSPNCPMASGRSLTLVAPSEARSRGLEACGICLHPAQTSPTITSEDPIP
jgi:hypothetical protein